MLLPSGTATSRIFLGSVSCREMFYLSLCVNGTFGTPNLAIMRSLNGLCKVSAIAVRSATNSVHFENRSICTKSIFPAACLWFDSNFRRTSHLRTYALASLCIPGQSYRAARWTIVLRLPTWPSRRDSLARPFP